MNLNTHLKRDNALSGDVITLKKGRKQSVEVTGYIDAN